MRRFQPLYLAAAVTIALSGSAIAQTTTPGAVRATTTASGTSSPSGTTTATPAASTSGGCVGTGGSSCTATNSSAAPTPTGTTTTSTPTPGVTAQAGSSNSVTTAGSPAGSSGSAMGSNQTNVDPATTRPGSFEPGGTFGPNAGTSGTATNQNTLPGSTGALVLPASGLEGQAGTQQNVVIQQPQPVLQQRAATPMFDEVAREGRAKERARKARGEEPRIIGIAPRTDRDLTHQMPDDPIIRY